MPLCPHRVSFHLCPSFSAPPPSADSISPVPHRHPSPLCPHSPVGSLPAPLLLLLPLHSLHKSSALNGSSNHVTPSPRPFNASPCILNKFRLYWGLQLSGSQPCLSFRITWNAFKHTDASGFHRPIESERGDEGLGMSIF